MKLVEAIEHFKESAEKHRGLSRNSITETSRKSHMKNAIEAEQIYGWLEDYKRLKAIYGWREYDEEVNEK